MNKFLNIDKISPVLLKRKSELLEIKKEIENFLNNCSEGQLRVANSKKASQYYWITNQETDKNGKYISKKDIKLVKELAQKDYYKKLLVNLKRELQHIDKMAAQYKQIRLDDIYKKISNSRKELIHSIFYNSNEFVKEWETVTYHTKEFDKDYPEYFTLKGERVRSKSEVILANTLKEYNVPYRYEWPVKLKGFGSVHADFCCLNVDTGKEYLWEHFGMMDNVEYAEKAVKKLEKYILNGYMPGENFITTFESHYAPLNMMVIQKLIKKYLI